MQLGAAKNQPLHRDRLEPAPRVGSLFDALEKLPVPNERHFDRFDIAGALVACGKRGEQLEVVDDGKRWRKGADKILFAESIDAIFDPDTGVGLAQRRRGNAHMTDSAV